MPTEFQLQFLCSLISKSFDGNRTEYHEFVTNCNNAVELATDEQQRPLFVYIISRLTGSVRSQLQGKTYTSWSELREILSTFYQDKKHYIQLMEELNTMKQNLSESVLSFHDRIDKLTVRLLSSITYKSRNEQLGKIDTIKELALSRFIHHSKPEISRFLRAQSFDDISEALSKAIEEERAINISHQEFRTKPAKFCNFCKKSGHDSKNCFRKQPNQSINFNQNRTRPGPSSTSFPNNSSSNNNYNNNQNFNPKFCNYCKNRGHIISECRKREYNNKRKEQLNNANSNNPRNNSERVNLNLNSNNSQVDALLVESDIQMA